MRDQIEDEVKHVVEDAMKNYDQAGHDGVTSTWNKLQEEFQCCCVNNASDWKDPTMGIGLLLFQHLVAKRRIAIPRTMQKSLYLTVLRS